MGLVSFFKNLLSKDTVGALDDVLGDVAITAGQALAEAELRRALDDLEVEAEKIGDPSRRAVVLTGIAALRLAATTLIATIGEEGE